MYMKGHDSLSMVNIMTPSFPLHINGGRSVDKGKSEGNTLFCWIPPVLVVPDFVGDNWDGENDGVREGRV